MHQASSICMKPDCYSKKILGLVAGYGFGYCIEQANTRPHLEKKTQGELSTPGIPAMLRFCLAGAVVAALTLPLPHSIGPAYAGEKTLDFQLLVKYFEPRTLEAKNIEDQTITQSKGFGVAVFKDGRLGTVDFIMTMDKQKGAGTAFGYRAPSRSTMGPLQSASHLPVAHKVSTAIIRSCLVQLLTRGPPGAVPLTASLIRIRATVCITLRFAS